jgi:signal peptidase I
MPAASNADDDTACLDSNTAIISRCPATRLYLIQMLADEDKGTTLQLALECLTASGRLRLRVTGASMLPAIPSGSVVLIRRVAPAEVNPGDVILTCIAEGVRLHRLIEIRGQGADALWITRGDNHRHCDPPLSAGHLLGVLTRIEELPEPVRWFSRLLNAGSRIARAA